MNPGGQGSSAAQDREAGFGLVEALAAMVILMVVLVSLATLLTDSVSTALVTKQREAAASLASDVVENGKALGQTCLASNGASSSCPTFTASAFSLVRNGAGFVSPAVGSYTVDRTSYAITTTVTCGGTACSSSYAGAVSIAVTVTWTQAGLTSAYFTSALVGGN